MHLIFLIFGITAVSTYADFDSGEAKFIDLLPEKEKKEFLERIARRILEETKTQDVGQPSGELSDDQLDVHGEFVTKLLKEESRHLRRNNNETVSNKMIDHSSTSNSEESKGDIEKDVISSNEKNKLDHIDLTREAKRTKRNKSKEASTSNESVKSETEVSETTLTELHITTESTNIEKGTEKISIEIKMVNGSDEGTSSSDEVRHSTVNLKAKKSLAISEVPVVVVYDTTAKKGDTNYKHTTKFIELETQNPVTENVEIRNSIKSAINSQLANYSAEEKENAHSETESEEKPESYGIPTELVTEKTSTEPISISTPVKSTPKLTTQDTTTIKQVNEITSKNANPILPENEIKTNLRSGAKLHSGETEYISITELPYSSILATTAADLDKQLLPETSTLKTTEASNDTGHINIETTKHIEVASLTTEKSLTKTTDAHLITKKELTVPNLLRQRLENKEQVQIDDTETFFKIQSKLNDNKVKEYSVYEISPNESPYKPTKQALRNSLRSDQNWRYISKEIENDSFEDNPHYVPVHNYAPNYAYFDPRNQQGPNYQNDGEELEKFDVVDTRDPDNDRIFEYFDYGRDRESDRSDSSDSNVRERIKGGRHKQDKLNLPLKYSVVTPGHNNFASDYYFGNGYERLRDESSSEKQALRIPGGFKFPNSDEADSTLQTDRYRNHLQAVRKILFENHRFGSIKQSTEIPPKVTIPRLDSGHNGPNGDNRPVLGGQEYLEGYGKAQNEKHKTRTCNSLKCILLRGHDKDEATETAALKNIPIETPVHSDKDMLLKMSDASDFIPSLQKLQTLKRSSEDIEAFVVVLNDMIQDDSAALRQYDWVTTTLDIRACIHKLRAMAEKLQEGSTMEPTSISVLKLFLYLHKQSKGRLRSNSDADDSKVFENNRSLLPRNRYRTGQILVNFRALSWLRTREEVRVEDDLRDFEEFLDDLEFGLHDLHNAIKHIALVTKYKRQRWFQNLKELYLNEPSRKELLEVTLHLTAARIVELAQGIIDERENRREERKTVERLQEEFLFTLRLLEEIKCLVN